MAGDFSSTGDAGGMCRAVTDGPGWILYTKLFLLTLMLTPENVIDME